MKMLDKEHNVVQADTLPDITGVNWYKVVKRANSPLMNSYLRVGDAIINPELGFDSRMPTVVLLNYDVYHSEDEFARLQQTMIAEAEKDDRFLSKYFAKALQDSEDIVSWAKGQDFTDLLQGFQEYTQRAIKLMSHLFPPLGPEEWMRAEIEAELAKHIDPKKDFSVFLDTMTSMISSTEPSTMQLKRAAMLQLAVDKAPESAIRKVYDQYKWLEDHGIWFEPVSFETFTAEIEAMKDPEKELQAMQEETAAIKERQAALTSKYKFSERLLRLFVDAQQLPLVRFRRLEALIESAYALNDLFEAIQKKLGLQSVSAAYYWEIEKGLEGEQLDTERINKRRKWYGFILKDMQLYDLDGPDENILKIVEGDLLDENVVKGQVAHRGKVTGVARVLNSAKEIDKVKQGDILITGMTTPDYVPAIEKAAAMVTDEGGLSCHAAIVAREMSTPCVIGTKDATRIFKDGDLIEVDAEKGIVKIISQ